MKRKFNPDKMATAIFLIAAILSASLTFAVGEETSFPDATYRNGHIEFYDPPRLRNIIKAIPANQDIENSLKKYCRLMCDLKCVYDPESNTISKILSINESEHLQTVTLNGRIGNLDNGEFIAENPANRFEDNKENTISYRFNHNRKKIDTDNPDVSDLIRTYCAPFCSMTAVIDPERQNILEIKDIKTEKLEKDVVLEGRVEAVSPYNTTFFTDNGDYLLRIQTYPEENFQFKKLFDVCGSEDNVKMCRISATVICHSFHENDCEIIKINNMESINSAISKNLDTESLVEAGNEFFKAKDYAEAFQAYLQAAKAGNAVAVNKLANMFHEGNGVKKDLNTAARLYAKAA